MSTARDSTTVRRGLQAGLLVWALLGGGGLMAVLVAGAGGAAGFAALLLGFALGALVTTGWLLLAALLDLLAGEPPTRFRWIVTAVAALVAAVAFVAAPAALVTAG